MLYWVLVVGLGVGPLLLVYFYSSQSRAYEAERIPRELKAIAPWVPRSLTGLLSCHLSGSSYVCYIKGPAFSAILSRKNRRKYDYSVFPESNFHLKINLFPMFKFEKVTTSNYPIFFHISNKLIKCASLLTSE